jgi:CheY-like chemotaxis protein
MCGRGLSNLQCVWRSLDLSLRGGHGHRALEADDKWILLVEDDDDSRESLVDLLEQAGYSTKAVASSAAAMEELHEELHTRRPCLILADYLLDDVNGRELRRQVRASLGAEAPPFVLLTGVARSELKDISGVILTKPFDVDRLLDVVAEHWNV